jgi:hypothetical protein
MFNANSTAMNRWSYSLLLLGSYVAVFEAWLVLSPAGVVASTVAATLALVVLERHFARLNYFRNGWDRFIHAAVIGDLALEGLWIRWHEGRSFHLCAAAFALVILGYRLVHSRRHPAASGLSGHTAG